MIHFSISEAPLDVAALAGQLHDAHAGGYASFEGWVRDHHKGRAVNALDYQAYTAMAEGAAILAEAAERFAVVHAACVHRVGALAIGDIAVWVGVSAAHRDAAFAACRFIIDEVKSRVPIWKREHYVEGASDWIHPES